LAHLNTGFISKTRFYHSNSMMQKEKRAPGPFIKHHKNSALGLNDQDFSFAEATHITHPALHTLAANLRKATIQALE